MKIKKTKLNPAQIIHILQNPYGFQDRVVRKAQLEAAILIKGYTKLPDLFIPVMENEKHEI